MNERVAEKVVDFEVDVDRVWEAITDPDELARWFGDAAEVDLRHRSRSVPASPCPTGTCRGHV